MFKWFRKKKIKAVKPVVKRKLYCFICQKEIDREKDYGISAYYHYKIYHKTCLKDMLCEPENYSAGIIAGGVAIMKDKKKAEEHKKQLCIEAKTYCVED